MTEISSFEFNDVGFFDGEAWNGLCPECGSEVVEVDSGFTIGTFNKKDFANTFKPLNPIFMRVYNCNSCGVTILKEEN